MFKTLVSIDGMACGMCEAHINDAIRKYFDVKKVTSSHSKKETVIISKEILNQDKLKQVIQDTGYTFISATSEPYEEKGFFSKLFKK